MPESNHAGPSEETSRNGGKASARQSEIAPTTDMLDPEQEAEADFERHLDRLDEEGRRLLRELREAEVAAERKRWWVIGPRTIVS